MQDFPKFHRLFVIYLLHRCRRHLEDWVAVEKAQKIRALPPIWRGDLGSALRFERQMTTQWQKQACLLPSSGFELPFWSILKASMQEDMPVEVIV